MVLFSLSLTIVTAQPDLLPDTERLVQTLTTDLLETHDPCYVEEGCVTGLGDRQVLRFETMIRNVGNADFILGSPPDHPEHENGTWEWDQCHRHWHYESYAQYLLFNQRGETIPIGYKTGFCLLDSGCDTGIPKYHCGNQGISASCYDIYRYSTDCQWIDVTDVPNGTYTLALRINWNRAPDLYGTHERDYSNNEARVCFQLTRTPEGRHRITVLNDPNCQCPDADRDGYCSVDDCDDNNAAIPSSQACPTSGDIPQSNGGGTTNGGNTTTSSNANVFELFPWLTTIVTPSACTSEQIQVFYEHGGYYFIYVVRGNSRMLFFQDGTFYCEDQPGLNCLSAYNLSNPLYTWQCSQTQSNSNESPSTNSNEDLGTTSNQVFIDFPWLLDHYLATTCIRVYEYDIYYFVHLQESTENYGRLFLGNGVFYCNDQPIYDCRGSYGLDDSDLVATWNCPNGLQNSEHSNTKLQTLELSESSAKNKTLFINTDFQLYPNPATNQIILDFGTALSSENNEVQIINYTGQIVHQVAISDRPTSLNINILDIPNGFYLVVLKTNEEQVVKKLLVSK